MGSPSLLALEVHTIPEYFFSFSIELGGRKITDANETGTIDSPKLLQTSVLRRNAIVTKKITKHQEVKHSHCNFSSEEKSLNCEM